MSQVLSNGGALDGVRVVDFGQYLCAPMVGMFLADNGADVIHVDPPGGPRWAHPANAALHRSKRSIALDLKSEEGLAAARRLVDTADIVLENFRPGVMRRLGLDAVAAMERNRRLIWCAMPGFAADDARAAMPAWEGVVCAAAGLYPQQGFAQGDPVFTALPLASNFGAFVAAHRVAAALLARQRSGKGQFIESSLFEACFQAIGLYAEAPVSRDLSRTALVRLRPLMRMRKAADGTYIYFDSPLRGVQALLDRYLPDRTLLALDDAGLEDTARLLDELILQKPGREWERICQEELKGAFGLVQTLPAWLEDAHALESQTILPVDDAILGPTVQPGFPVLLSETRPAVRWGRGKSDPAPGEEIGWLAPARTETPRSEASELPLDGVRVLDCSTLLAGPTTTRVLAQYGAQVIKVDRAGIALGDVDPLTDDEFAFIGARTVNAGKRMVYLDLKTAEGRDILCELVKRSDVVHHNFTPVAASRLGVSGDQLRAVNASVILSTMSLHSHGGFRAEYRGHDMLGQMITGMGHRAGGSGDPQVVATYLNDNAAGHLHAFGVMLALFERQRSGRGQDVNGSLSRTATLHQVPFMVGFPGRIWNEPSGPQTRGWHVLDRLYRCADGWLYVASAPDHAVAALRACPSLAGVAQASTKGLEERLEERFGTLPVEVCAQELRAAGVGAQRHMRLAELTSDAYVIRKGYLAVTEHPGIGRALGIGLLVYGQSVERGEVRVLAARRPGLDTEAVLGEIGYGHRVGELLEKKVVASGLALILNTPAARGFWDGWARQPVARMAGIAPDAAMARHIDEARPLPVLPASRP